MSRYGNNVCSRIGIQHGIRIRYQIHEPTFDRVWDPINIQIRSHVYSQIWRILQ
jgi:hypothetical protein